MIYFDKTRRIILRFFCNRPEKFKIIYLNSANLGRVIPARLGAKSAKYRGIFVMNHA